MPPVRILVTPRWGGTIDDDWYPWLASQVPGIERVALPDASAPTIDRCARELAAALGGGEPAIVVAHSVSCQGWLHAMGRTESRLVGFLAVAGWWTVDEPWPSIQPWIDATHDRGALRTRLGEVRVLLGTNDPFTRDQQANAALWRARLGAAVRIVEDGRHFNRPEEPDVLLELSALRAAVA
jgi:predicted alpha/beta hydrolase family esterase